MVPHDGERVAMVRDVIDRAVRHGIRDQRVDLDGGIVLPPAQTEEATKHEVDEGAINKTDERESEREGAGQK